MWEVLGQRGLLGLGVVLVWLVLFHLLVNIWLLCVFTSLLVVLGGWLGSQAVLDSNTRVHLERFITLDQLPSSEEDQHHLDQEIHSTVRKIIRDFVSSWFSTVSSERGFETQVQDAMVCMAMELKRRAGHVDRKVLTQRILDLLGCHLQDYLKAEDEVSEQQTSGSCSDGGERLWRAYSSLTPPHPAVTSEAVEVNYARALVDTLLHVLVPPPHLETPTGRFVVGELITCNVLLPLIHRLADPDWLNLLLLQIFRGNGKQPETAAEEPPTSSPTLPPPPTETQTCPQEETSLETMEDDVPPPRTQTNNLYSPDLISETLPELSSYETIHSEEVDLQTVEEEESSQPFLRCYLRGGKSNPFYQETDSDLDSPLAEYQRISMDSLVTVGQDQNSYDGRKDRTSSGEDLDVCSSPSDASYPRVLVTSDPAAHLNGSGTGGVSNPSKDLLLGVDPGLVSPSQASSPVPSFSFEPLSSPDGPVLIQNLRITGTITAKEHRGTGSHPYTLYTIKYETAMYCENPASVQSGSEDPDPVQPGCESPVPVQPVAYHMVNRRYSEFLNLQTRLEERNELRKLIKGVKGPKKMFPDMPFGNMDSDKIEARKGLLETFLKQLCSIPEITNSEQMQEFLALNTDARIAFVKKPFIVSRIDKIVVNAIVDTLKTAFPRSEPVSPTEDNEGEADGGRMSSEKKKSRMKFSSKNLPIMNGADVRPPLLFSWEHTSTVFNRMSLGDLNTFITEREQLSIRPDPDREDRPVTREYGDCREHRTKGDQDQDRADTALAEVVLNILSLLMQQQWSWMCTENIQRSIRMLFGTLINRWLEVGVANLTCTRYWVVYLQVIQEAVWPGGNLPSDPQQERSQQQKDATKQEVLVCLMRLLPDLISEMLGSDKYKLSWKTALDSLQNPHINRHLVYCVFDLLYEFLVPEIPDQDFQRSLLQSLSKNPEKLLA